MGIRVIIDTIKTVTNTENPNTNLAAAALSSVLITLADDTSPAP